MVGPIRDMTLGLVLGAGVLLLAVWGLLERRRRRRLVARLRAEWGRPMQRDRDMEAIAHYHWAFAEVAEEPLDERTGKDLDLDAVFEVLDRTESPVGQQPLYHRLRTTPTAANRTAFEALTARLGENASERERLQASLFRLHQYAGDVWWLTQPGVLDTRRVDVVFPSVGLVVPSAMLLAVVWPPAFLAAFLGIFTNMAVRYRTAPRLRGPLNYFRQVAPLLAVAHAAGYLLATGAAHPIGQSLPADLARLRPLRRIAGWVTFDPNAADALTAVVSELANMILLLDVTLLLLASRHIRAHGKALVRTFAAVGTLDAAVAVASFRAGTTGWMRPVFRPESGAATLVGLRHPLLDEAVPNSIELDPQRGVLVTGSNMSGKSTFLRTVGVNAILAQTVNTCLATRYEAPLFVVRSVIGRSYYQDEIEVVLALVDASRSSRPHLFLFDELFRGTSTVERVAAAEATLAELIDGDGDTPSSHIVIAATHDRELVELMPRTCTAYHFSDRIEADELVFDYRLRKGPARTWNAIALLEICGAPPRLVERARARTVGLTDQRRLGRTEPTR